MLRQHHLLWHTLYRLSKFKNSENPEGGHLNVTWRGGAHFLRISTTRLGEKIAFRYPVSDFLDYKTIGKQSPFVLKHIVITRLGISDQFSYLVQEFMLKNDTLENGTSRIGLYGSAPPREAKSHPFAHIYPRVTYNEFRLHQFCLFSLFSCILCTWSFKFMH